MVVSCGVGYVPGGVFFLFSLLYLRGADDGGVIGLFFIFLQWESASALVRSGFYIQTGGEAC